MFAKACEWWGKESVDGVRPHGMERPNYTGLVFHGVQRFLGNRSMCGAVIEFGTRGVDAPRAQARQWLGARTVSMPTCAGPAGRHDGCLLSVRRQWRKDTLSSGLKLTDQAIKGLAAW